MKNGRTDSAVVAFLLGALMIRAILCTWTCTDVMALSVSPRSRDGKRKPPFDITTGPTLRVRLRFRTMLQSDRLKGGARRLSSIDNRLMGPCVYLLQSATLASQFVGIMRTVSVNQAKTGRYDAHLVSDISYGPVLITHYCVFKRVDSSHTVLPLIESLAMRSRKTLDARVFSRV